jgi:6,7-dimethyl-8-ribityllumazine synthase
MLDGAVTQAHEMGVADEDMQIYRVPGAFELPLIAQRLAESSSLAAFLAELQNLVDQRSLLQQ